MPTQDIVTLVAICSVFAAFVIVLAALLWDSSSGDEAHSHQPADAIANGD